MANDAEIRFKASLEDNVSPKVDKLEQKLRQAGASPAEIKMMLKAYDEATPKIKEAQKHLNNLPREHMIKMQGDNTHVLSKIAQVKQQTAQPVKLTFVDNLKDTMDKMFQIRSSAMPGGMGIPGLRAFGAGAALTGAAAAGAGLVKQGVQVNSDMEQSMVTLTQTLKDQTKATAEMGKIVQIAQKTPFQYKDVLQADVRLRSYNIPSMKGEGGPGNQGWLKSAGDMAAALNTPITQAVEAIADARQGYFVRMMSYGIRMMREDFQAGGKFAGMTYEQGLAQAVRRFEGAQEAQSKTFQGITSNIKDVLQQQIIKPIGAVPFEAMRGSAEKLQNKMLDPKFQEQLGKQIEKVQHFFVNMFMTVQRGQQYFKQNLQQPLTELAKTFGHLGGELAKIFGGVLLEGGKVLLNLVGSVEKLATYLVTSNTPLLKLYAGFKALSILGFTGPAEGLKQINHSMNLLHPSVMGVIEGFHKIVSSGLKLELALLVKHFAEVASSNDRVRSSMKRMGDDGASSIRKIRDELDGMSGGLDASSSKMKKLFADAADAMPKGTDPQVAVRQAQVAAAMQQRYGVDSNQANRLMSGEHPNTKREVDEAARALLNLKRAADALGMSMKDSERIMKEFGKPAAKVGLGGLSGAPFLAALSKGTNSKGFLTQEDNAAGIYSGDAKLLSLLQARAMPSVDQLGKVGNLGQYYNFTKRGPNFRRMFNTIGAPPGDDAGVQSADDKNINTGQQFNDIIKRYQSNFSSAARSQQGIDAITRGSGMRDRIKLPDMTDPAKRDDITRLQEVEKGLQGTNDASKQAVILQKAIADNNTQLEQSNQIIATYTQNTNNIQKNLANWSNAQQELSLRMQEFQHTLVPLQQHIEDAQFAMQKYQQSAMRPLEREMARLGQTSAELGNRMTNAQYGMSKFSSGLLEGEQAALNQLHALEKYQRQLTILQLTYQTMGADLGTQFYDQGASVRVEPMQQFTLGFQQERLQRRQALAQAKYEDKFGEGHYKMQQAARSQLERQEMPLGDRLKGIRDNRKVIDETTNAQRNLTNVQFELQKRMFKVNEHLQDQQDAIAGLSEALQEKQLHGGLREMQEAEYRLGHKTSVANIELNRQNALLATANDRVTDIKDTGQKLSEWLGGMFDFGGKDLDNMNKMIDFAEKSGQLKHAGAEKLRDLVDKANAAQKNNVPTTKQDWTDILKSAFIGAFSGDTWTRLGETLNSGMHKVNNIVPGAGWLGDRLTGPGAMIATVLTVGTSAAIAGSLIPHLMKQALLRAPVAAFAKAAMMDDLGKGLAGALTGERSARMFGSIPGARMLPGSLRLGRIAEGGGVAMEFARMLGGGKGLGQGVKEAFSLSKRLRQLGGATLGTLAGGLLSPVVGPMGPVLGGLAGSQASEYVRLRDLGKLFSPEGRDAIKARAQLQREQKLTEMNARIEKASGVNVSKQGRAAARQERAAAKQAAAVADQADTVREAGKINEIHRLRFGERIRGMRLRGLGRFGKIIASFGIAVEGIKQLPGWLAQIFNKRDPSKPIRDKLPEAERAANEARSAVQPAVAEAKQTGLLRRVGGRGLRALGAAGDAYLVGDTINQAIHGHHGAQAALGVGAVLAKKRGSRAILEGLEAGLTGSKLRNFVIKKVGGHLAGPIGLALLGQDMWNIMQGETSLDPQEMMKKQADALGAMPGGAGLHGTEMKYLRGVIKNTERGTPIHEDAKDLRDQLKRRYDITYDFEQTLKDAQDKADTNRRRAHKDTEDSLRDYTNKVYGNRTTDLKDHMDKFESVEDDGFKSIKKKAAAYLKDMHHTVNASARSMGVSMTNYNNRSSDNNAGSGNAVSDGGHGFAHGGFPSHLVIPGKKDSKGYLARVGEEDDELIIPLAPHRRERAKSLLSQAAGMIGGVKAYGMGGMTDRAYLAARASYTMARRSFANGGFSGPHGSLSGMTPLANFAQSKFGLSVSAGRDDHNRLTSGGNVSDHSWGGALDESNSTHPTPEMGAFYTFLRTRLKNAIKQVIYMHNLFNTGGAVGNYPAMDHFNHVHVAMLPQYANNPELMADMLKKAGAGQSIEDLLVNGGGAAGGGVTKMMHLKKPPKSLQELGVAGNLTYAVLNSIKKAVMGHVNKQASSTNDLSGFSGGGSSKANMALGHKMAAAMGWTGGEWNALRSLWIGESGWNSGAHNPSSGAHGIPQALPGSKMASAGKDWATNAATQIKWGLGYIKDRYGDPISAFRAWNGRSPHWYAPGKREIQNDQEVAMLHRGEMVLNAAQATSHRKKQEGDTGGSWSERKTNKLVDAIEAIQEHIKKVEKHLSHANDRDDKKADNANLRDLNDELRKRWGQLQASRERDKKGLARDISKSGDLSGGEDTLAGVAKEKALYKKETDPKDDRLLHEMRNLAKAAHSLLHTAKTGVQKTLARRAVGATKRAVKSAKRVVDYTRGRYLVGAARRGVNAKLIKSITGHPLKGRQREAYLRAAKSKPGAARDKALRALAKVLHTDLNKNSKHLASLRKEARHDASAARRAVSKAAASQGKRISASGKLVAAKHTSAVKAAAHHTATSHGKHIKDEGGKARAATDKVRKSSDEGVKTSKHADNKRSKAEMAADRREREFQKTALHHLQAIASRDTSINITNHAQGAKLSSVIIRGRRSR